MLGVGRCRSEVELLVKRQRLFILRVDHKRANTSNFRRLKGPLDRVFQKTGPESLPLPRDANSESRQKHNRYGVPSEPLLETLGSVVVTYLSDHQRIVSGDLGFVGDRDIGLRGSRLLILECIP